LLMAEEDKKPIEKEEKTSTTQGVLSGQGKEKVENKLVEKPVEKNDDKKSLPAVSKETSKKKKESFNTLEVEREYVIPLKRGVLNVPRYRRAKKAIKVIKEFLARHMRVEDRDLRKIKIDIYLNNEVWFRGIKKPANKIKVKAIKRGDTVYAYLADEPEVVKFAKARAEKKKVALEAKSSKKKKKDATPDKKEETDKDSDGVEDKVEEKEDRKAGAIKEEKVQKAVAKEMSHTAQGKHKAKTAPVRKTLR